MKPVLTPLMSQIRLALRDLVGMMGEYIIHTPTVKIQILAQVLHTDTGTLNMPAWVPKPPWTLPFQLLVVKLGLGEPQHKITFVLLVSILLHILPHTHKQLFLTLIGEDIILIQFGCVKINVPTALIGIFLFQQPSNDTDKIIDTVCSRLHHIRPFNIQFPAVIKKSIRVESGNLHNGLMLPFRPLEHLILTGIRIAGKMPHISDIHHTLYVISYIAKCFFQHILHNITSQIPNMRIVIYCRSTGVHCYFSILLRHKPLQPLRCRIVKKHFIFHDFILL